MKVAVDHAGADAIPLPATMIHDLSARLSKSELGVRLRLYSSHPFPSRKDRTLRWVREGGPHLSHRDARRDVCPDGHVETAASSEELRTQASTALALVADLQGMLGMERREPDAVVAPSKSELKRAA